MKMMFVIFYDVDTLNSLTNDISSSINPFVHLNTNDYKPGAVIFCDTIRGVDKGGIKGFIPPQNKTMKFFFARRFVSIVIINVIRDSNLLVSSSLLTYMAPAR